jgi:hypothetical protein
MPRPLGHTLRRPSWEGVCAWFQSAELNGQPEKFETEQQV